MTRGVDGKQVASDLHRGIRGANDESGCLECMWDCSRGDQTDEHHRKQEPPYRQLVRVKKVDEVRSRCPDGPHHSKEHGGLDDTLDGGVIEEVMRQLGDRERIDEVEEELNIGHASQPG